MSTTLELAAEVRELSQLVATGRRTQALSFVRAVMGTGVESATLIEHMLVPVEQRIGAMWEAGALDVASSRAATAIVESALDAIVAAAPRAPSRGSVIVACPLGGWHSLPARIVGELLRLDGWDAVLAGASTPADALVQSAAAAGTRIVALSCSMPPTLLAAADAITALHAADIAVVVGGAAFGTDDRRAAAIGADAWCATARDASHVLDAWIVRLPRLRSPIAGDAPDRLDQGTRAGIVDSALRAIGRTMPDELHALVGAHLDANDLARVLDLVAVAFLTGDETVLHDEVARLRRFLAARRVPPDAVDAGVIALANASPPGLVRTLLLDATQAASPRAGDIARPEFVPAWRA